MNQAILVSFRSEQDRIAVRQSLTRCASLDSAMNITEFDNSKEALAALTTEEFACAIIELCDHLPVTVPSSIDMPIVFVVADDHPKLMQEESNRFLHVYCDKNQFDRNWLNAYLPMVLDRHKLTIELKNAAKLLERSSFDKEISSLSWHYRTTATATAMGLGSVRESNPEKFKEFVDVYCEIMQTVLDERTFKIPATSSSKLHGLSQELGLLNAGPRDVIELYAVALKQKLGETTNAKNRAFSNCAQVLALELMGYLVSFYRNILRLSLQSVAGQADDQRTDR